jgi:uncharacterized membrane protein YccC
LKVYGASFLAFSLLFSIGAWHGFSVGIHTWVDLAIGIALACVGTFFAARVSQQSLIKRFARVPIGVANQNYNLRT